MENANNNAYSTGGIAPPAVAENLVHDVRTVYCLECGKEELSRAEFCKECSTQNIRCDNCREIKGREHFSRKQLQKPWNSGKRVARCKRCVGGPEPYLRPCSGTNPNPNAVKKNSAGQSSVENILQIILGALIVAEEF